MRIGILTTTGDHFRGAVKHAAGEIVTFEQERPRDAAPPAPPAHEERQPLGAAPELRAPRAAAANAARLIHVRTSQIVAIEEID